MTPAERARRIEEAARGLVEETLAAWLAVGYPPPETQTFKDLRAALAAPVEEAATPGCGCLCHIRTAWCFDCRDHHRPPSPPATPETPPRDWKANPATEDEWWNAGHCPMYPGEGPRCETLEQTSDCKDDCDCTSRLVAALGLPAPSPAPERCEACGGNGRIFTSATTECICPRCGGTGSLVKGENKPYAASANKKGAGK